ncbi:helix-turn-helix domain-containing protein [Arenibacter algicola]|uniref:HTH-type transcriptional activator Btr n=1 Tax=Arenibacter algicola TaxID=616991 RepID=A0A221UT25_9FLAO|nr:helix-turn-helix domain-containing protein [Arenibacter algicola]ASO04061.1 HTH-type transcriptional activator Btr [Arenibacter algicola]|tara:strand:- start:11 stop:907 length:897 start_codon:yes stop_codon:yes gene_type:complete
MKHYKTISELCKSNGFPPPENPLLGILTFEESEKCTFIEREFTMGFYTIALTKLKSGTFQYGRTKYDHDNGSLAFLKPHQKVLMNNVETSEKGFLLYIHEDFLINHSLHSEISNYGYFDYEVNEALHLSPKEEDILWDLFNKIQVEYYNNQDEYSKDIVLTHIDSFLKYAQRFYKRQFLNRSVLSGSLITKFTDILKHYFENGGLQKNGLPSVKYMAAKLSLSPKYLSDLLKQETGKTALEHIHIALVVEAKNILMGTDKTVAETAYQLGFENPPYFSRLFKKEVGVTPTEYREQFLN